MSAPNGNENRLASEIAVTSTDPEKKEDGKKPNGDIKGKGKGDEKKEDSEIVR